ncbi:hypothetical protein [Ensifer adhaerens]|uniref:hypothetical protein n=1 Tax=Ensifer adhaerens TaxID=106592 RepID=UPI0011781BD5|nr:hypothetical protein [Ensifer adhaerens]
MLIPWSKLIGGVLVLAAITWLVVEIRRDATEDYKSSIERQNNASGDAASDARSDFDLCLDRGGVWDYGAGKCRRSAAGRRN